MKHTNVFGYRATSKYGITTSTAAVVQQECSTKLTTPIRVNVVGSMHRKQYHMNTKSHASLVAHIATVSIQAHLVPQQPGLVNVADAVCLSH